MYAVIATGGKQYQVKQGSILEIETIAGEKGETLELSEVLLVGNDEEVKIGKPNIPGAKVTCVILEQKRAPKVLIFKKLRRHGRRLKNGHRQNLTRVKVSEISL